MDSASGVTNTIMRRGSDITYIQGLSRMLGQLEEWILQNNK